MRDGFLTFFADDAVQISAGSDGSKTTIVRAKEGLQKLALPKLPEDVQYRFVGKHLLLYDAKANLIIDFMLNAIA